MPSDPRNSLGWMDLQLRANRLQQEQQAELQRQQFNREAQQQDFTNALAVGKQGLAAKDAEETRKLQLAELLQRTKLMEAGKDRRLDDKQANDKPEQESKVTKNNAQAGLATAQANSVSVDDKEAERHHRADEQGTLRGQDMSLLGKDLAWNPVYGDRDPAASQRVHSILGLRELTPPDPNLVRTPKSEVGKVFNDVRQGQNSQIDVDTAIAGLDKADASDFGVRGSRLGFNAPIVGRVNPNTIQDIIGSVKKAAGDDKNPDSAATQRRALIEQSYGRQVANTIRYLSGLASSDQEAARIFAQFGVKPDDSGKIDIFGADLDTLKTAMGAAKEYISKKKANDVAIAQQGGVKVTPEPQRRGGETGQAVDPTEDPAAARKRRTEVARNDPAIKAKLKAARDALPPDMPPEQKAEELHRILEQLVP
jgi:hypothetical protein